MKQASDSSCYLSIPVPTIKHKRVYDKKGCFIGDSVIVDSVNRYYVPNEYPMKLLNSENYVKMFKKFPLAYSFYINTCNDYRFLLSGIEYPLVQASKVNKKVKKLFTNYPITTLLIKDMKRLGELQSVMEKTSNLSDTSRIWLAYANKELLDLRDSIDYSKDRNLWRRYTLDINDVIDTVCGRMRHLSSLYDYNVPEVDSSNMETDSIILIPGITKNPCEKVLNYLKEIVNSSVKPMNGFLPIRVKPFVEVDLIKNEIHFDWQICRVC
jgi:hypothetical protein